MNGTSRSEGPLLLGTPNRTCAYCSLQLELSSPIKSDDSGSDRMINTTRKTATPYLMKGHLCVYGLTLNISMVKVGRGVSSPKWGTGYQNHLGSL